MELTCVFFGAVFLIAGIAFACGKVHVRLSAWKAMPPQEKAAVRIVPLCRNIGTFISLSGVIFLARGVWPACSGRGFAAAMIVWLIAAGLDVRYIGRSGRYLAR